MLIWIRAPSIAIGVLAAFVLLLSTVVSEEVSINSTSDNLDLSTELPVTEEIHEQQLMNLPFAERLRNACDLQNDRTSSGPIGRRAHFELEFLKDTLRYVNFTKQRALEALQNHTVSGCVDFHINNLPQTPTLDELKDMDIKGALNKIYSSVLVHSGYSYFISYQFESSENGCSNDINKEQRFAELSRTLAGEQRFLACKLQLGMKMLGYYQEDVSSVLNERVSNISQCSKRSLRDCQVMKSINNFLQILADYVSDYISGSTTSLPHIQRTMP